MELKDYIVEKLVTINVKQEFDNIDKIERQKAIEWLKGNGYELTEANVDMAKKKLSEMPVNEDAINAEAYRLMLYETDELVTMFNNSIKDILGESISIGVNPEQLFMDDEKALYSSYSFISFAPEYIETVEAEKRKFLRYGIIGRVCITEKRMFANYLEDDSLKISTVCFDLKNICSVGVGGNSNDEVTVTLLSGEKIKFKVPEAVETVMWINNLMYKAGK